MVIGWLLLSPLATLAQNTQTSPPPSTQTNNAPVAGTAAAGNEAAAAVGQTAPNNVKADSGNAAAGDSTALDKSTWQYTIYSWMVGLGALVARLGGWLLDASLAAFVVNMAEVADRMGLGLVIVSIWSVIRDLFNLVFIFALIWIGFQTILQTGSTDTKRLVGYLLVAALFINFSLYITQVIVDFSNIAAYQISNLMNIGTYDEQILGVEVKKVSSAFVAASDFHNFPRESQEAVAKLFGSESTTGETETSNGTFLLGFVVMAMLVIMGVVFAAGAVILFTRFVALVMIMMFSPAMFAGLIFPKFAAFGSKWWHYFINQAIVGPAYIFMLYIALRSLQGLGSLPEYTITGLIMYFLLVVAFVIAAYMVAKHFGGIGATHAVNLSKAAGRRIGNVSRRAAGGAVFGGAAWAGRNFPGQVAQRLAERDSLLEAASQGGVKGFAARRGLGLARAVGDSSFDARRIGGVGKSLGLGEGSKGGYKTKRDAINKSDKEYAKSLGTVGDEDETVKSIKEDIEKTEDKIKEAKLEKEGIRDPRGKKVIQGRINALEETLKQEKEDLKQEKMRRQIGSVAYSKNREGELMLLDHAQEELKELEREYKESTNTDLEEDARARKEIREKRKEVKKLQKSSRKGGYAGVLENSQWYTEIFKGRVPNQSHKSGKEIRKQYEGKLKQTKDDERFEGLREEFGKGSDKK